MVGAEASLPPTNTTLPSLPYIPFVLIMITRVIQMFGGEAELRSFPTKDLFTRVIHVKEESLLGGRSEAPLPPNKRFFLIVYKML